MCYCGKTHLKASFVVVLVLALCPTLVHAGTGKVFDEIFMHSQILKGERKYAVYLPPDYESSRRSYPVLYLLHGGGDDQTGWVQFGEVLHIADKAIFNGQATPMIIIMPDANAGRRGYWNDVSGQWRYEDFFFEELMPHVEKKYRIKREKRYRAVAGLSMGGQGTYLYALHRPDLFSSACPLSAGTGPRSPEDVKRRLKRYAAGSAEDLSGDLIEAYYKRHSALHLAETMPADKLKSIRWYIDCGDDDFLYEGNALMHIALRKRDIKHEYRVRDGAHNWTYWRTSLPKVLAFVSDAFHQH
jgi:enterochelin esterase-like enzyme